MVGAGIRTFRPSLFTAKRHDHRLDLPLGAGSIMFYAAGVASVIAQRLDLLAKLVDLRGHPDWSRICVACRSACPHGLADRPVATHYEDVAAVVREALGLGMEPVDDGLQTFEVLRLCLEVKTHRLFPECVEDYALKIRKLAAMSQIDSATEITARRDRQLVIGRVAELCSAYGAHLVAEARTFDAAEGRKWGSPLAERLAEDVNRSAAGHPLLAALHVDTDEMWLALKGVSIVVGRVGRDLQIQATPVNRAGFGPDESGSTLVGLRKAVKRHRRAKSTRRSHPRRPRQIPPPKQQDERHQSPPASIIATRIPPGRTTFQQEFSISFFGAVSGGRLTS
jgi:hypothetical protein